VAILAGGLAMRLKPLTEKIPKSLLDINGEPFIAHQLKLLRRNGIQRAIICAGFLGERIMQTIGDGAKFGLQVDYSFDYPRLLGTGGAVKKALPLLGERFFTLYGDSYLPCDYRAVQSAFETCGKLALMTVFRNEGQWDASNVEFAHGRIIAYNKTHRTPQMKFIDYGLGLFQRSAFDDMPEDKPFDLATLYQQLLQRDQLAGFEVPQRFYEIGSFAGIDETRRFLAAQPNPRPEPPR
jgi:NDP-sugar pyrophosphorylase family protein